MDLKLAAVTTPRIPSLNRPWSLSCSTASAGTSEMARFNLDARATRLIPPTVRSSMIMGRAGRERNSHFFRDPPVASSPSQDGCGKAASAKIPRENLMAVNVAGQDGGEARGNIGNPDHIAGVAERVVAGSHRCSLEAMVDAKQVDVGVHVPPSR